MTRKRLQLGSFALLAVALVATLFVLRPARKPDIILISIDSLRPDHLGCYGYPKPTSPVIDALAREGVVFENAVSTTSWTLPAHAAMLTGLYDSIHGAFDNGRMLCPSVVLLPELLQQSGYQTVGLFGGPYLHPAFGFNQGWDAYIDCMTPAAGDVVAQAGKRHNPSHDDITGPRTRDAFIEQLNKADNRPLFAFIHLWDVHYDFIPPQNYVDMFDPGYEGPITGRGFIDDPTINKDMPRRDLDHLIARYDGEIRYTDDMIAAMIQALKDQGRFENAIFIITADHGEEFFEHGRKGHHKTLYEEVLRVPLIVRAPQRYQPARITDQVSLVDLMPTLLAAADLPLTHQVSGRDITPLLTGRTMPVQEALIELLIDKNDLRGLRSNTSKITSIPSRGNPPPVEYYNLANDPGEQSPALAMTPNIQAALHRLAAELQAAAALQKLLGLTPCFMQPPAAIQNQLGGMGYLSSSEEEETPTEGEPGSPEPGGQPTP